MTDQQELDMRAWWARQEGESAIRSAVERARSALERAGADAPIGDVVALVREAAGELRNALERHNAPPLPRPGVAEIMRHGL
jgi:hypothetical protein